MPLDYRRVLEERKKAEAGAPDVMEQVEVTRG